MDEVLKDDSLKGTRLDGVLKGLQGKTLTKKKIFDFLADINLEDLYGKKENVIYGEHAATPIVTPPEPPKKEEPVKVEVKETIVIPSDFTLELIPLSAENGEKEEPKEIKCQACMKTFTANSSLKRHMERSTVCANWIELPQKTDIVPLTRGLHLIIDELLDKAISGGDLECKFCKVKFTNKGNHHKHFNYATVCNKLAYQEFKKLFLSL
jgi:hypothetical protein